MTGSHNSEEFRVFASCATEVGEGPLWNDAEQALYWIDVSRGAVYRSSYKNPKDSFEHWQLNIGKIGGAVFTKEGFMLLFAACGRVWKWKPGSEPELKAELKEAAESRFNDVIADPSGRVFCGVAPLVPGGTGSLWRMDEDCSFTCIEPVTRGMPNGMGFSPDLKDFYFTVTNERTIYRYSYNRRDGSLTGRSVFIVVPDSEGLPDGMTVDSEGCIWSGQWNGNRLVRYSIEGLKTGEICFPIAKVSCVTFGGPGYTDIFVTTANHPFDESVYNSSGAGSVFVMTQSIRGLPEFRV